MDHRPFKKIKGPLKVAYNSLDEDITADINSMRALQISKQQMWCRTDISPHIKNRHIQEWDRYTRALIKRIKSSKNIKKIISCG